MSHLPPYVPDHQRLRELAERVPGLHPDDVIAAALLRAVAAELTAQLRLNLDSFGISEGRLRVLGHILYVGGPATHSQLALAAEVPRGRSRGWWTDSSETSWCVAFRARRTAACRSST